MGALKYIAIAGGVALGVVLLRRALTPTQVKTPGSSPVTDIVSGAKQLLGAISGGSKEPGGTKFLPDDSNPTVVIGPDSASRSAFLTQPSPAGMLGPSPFSVSTTAAPRLNASLSSLPQPTAFTSAAQRSIAGVNPTSPYRLAPLSARS